MSTAVNNNRTYRAIYRAAVMLSPFILKKYSFQTDRVPQMDEPFLMLANHTTEQDFLMAMKAAHETMDIVCGEHLLRGKHGKMLKGLCDPIAEPKGASALPAVKEIIRRIRQGRNVLLFPEGSRSFNGETLPLDESIGKLVKLSSAALVTYRLRGGYFVAPRWAYHFRKGPVSGQVVRCFSSEELKRMSVSEITDVINHDLYENAYESQRQDMYAYKGEGLAEGLENYLVICPKCGAYDSFRSSGDAFHCEHCGYGGVIREDGFLQGEDLEHETVYDWGKWIEQRFDADMQNKPADALLFQEDNVRIYEIDPVRHSSGSEQTGSLLVYRDRMEMNGQVFRFSEIPYMAMLYFGKTLLFTCGKDYYGITGEAFHAWKTDRLYRLFAAESK